MLVVFNTGNSLSAGPPAAERQEAQGGGEAEGHDRLARHLQLLRFDSGERRA